MRLWAFDNLRLASIVVVVLFHAMVAYNARVTWWYVTVNDGVIRYAAFLSMIDLFLMAAMFFVSGFFAAKTFITRPVGSAYLSARIKRLLVPGYLQLVLICPLLFVFGTQFEFSIEGIARAYWNVWLAIASLGFGPVEAGSFGFAHHLWFVEVLFLVTVFFAFTWRLWRGLLLAEADSFMIVVSKLVFMLGMAWVLTLVAVLLGFTAHSWQSFTGLLQAQPVRVGCYFVAFAVGIYFYSLQQSMSIGRIALACAIAMVILFIGSKGFGMALYYIGMDNWALKSLTASSRVVKCFGYLFLSVLFFWRFLNIDFRWLRPLHGLNYGIYLMHMVYVVLLQKLFLRVELPVAMEVVLITLGAFTLSAISTYVKQRVLPIQWLNNNKPNHA